MRARNLHFWFALLILFGAVLAPADRLATKALAADTTILSQDFEDGQAGGWEPNYACDKAAVSTVVADVYGTKALHLKGKNSVACSPIITLDLSKVAEGMTLAISAKVRLASGTDNTHFTMHGVEGGADHYDWIGSPTATNDSSWTTIGGTYTVQADTTKLELYLEGTSSTSDIFMDDVSVTGSGGSDVPFTPKNVATYDFENGTQNWTENGAGSVATVTEAAYDGTHSLLSAGRTSAWNGPGIDLSSLLLVGAQYKITGFAKLAAGQSPANIKLTMHKGSDSGSGYTTLADFAPVTDSQWVKFQATYTRADSDKLFMYFESDNDSVSFHIDGVTIDQETPGAPPVTRSIQTDIPSIAETYKDIFLIGAEVQPPDLLEASGELLKKHFNSVVAGNQMKPESIQPTEGVFTWDEADKIADFARQNGLKMRGHTLVWHNQTPAWFFQDENGHDLTPTPENKQLVLNRLTTHIQTLMNRYKDVVDAWDVVNEVIDPGTDDGMRHSKWYELTGTDYIETAFKVAHDVDPDATLFINDYNTFRDPKKAQILYDFVKKEQAKGIPITGVGHQAHVSLSSPAPQAIIDTVNKFAELHVQQEITEMDVSIYDDSTSSYATISHDLLVKQGWRYKELFDAFKAVKDKLYRVTLWGMSDDTTWLRSFPINRLDDPLPFDDNLQAKPAYWGIVDPSRLEILKQNIDTAKKIDGNVDDLWKAISPHSILGGGSVSAGGFRTLWDDDVLYIYATVNDATGKSGDQVDVFLKDNDSITRYTFARYGTGSSAGATYKTFALANGGYAVEATIPLAGLTQGQTLGFDLRVADDNGSTVNLTSWNDTKNTQDTSSDNLGSLTLSKELAFTTAVYGNAVVDGLDNEPDWSRANTITTGTWIQGASGSTAKVKIMWGNNQLYLFAYVTDKQLSDASSNPWEQDSIEAFVDQNNGKTATYENDDGQYRVNYKNVQTYNGHAAADNFQTAAKVVYDGNHVAIGYNVEAAIKLDTISPEPGDLIGFDFQVNNDENGDGIRDSVVIWNDPTGLSYQNTGKWGVLELGDFSNQAGGGNTTVGNGEDGAAAQVDNNHAATVTVDKDTFAKALAGASDKTMVIKVADVGEANSVALTLPAEQMQAAYKSGIREVKIDIGLAVVSLDPALFQGSSGDVKLTVAKVAVSALPSKVQSVIGSNPVYDFSLSAGGQTISRFPGKEVRVTIPFTLQDGQNPNHVVVYSIADDGSLQVVKNGKYDAATATVEFAPNHFSKYAAAVANVSFTDINHLAWAKSSIEGMAVRGIVSGETDSLFAPQKAVTRAEFVQMLIGTLDLPADSYAATFTDVQSGASYYKALAAAQHYGIVAGRGDGTFGVNDNISRQEMAMMVYNALKAANVQMAGKEAAGAFVDADSIADYAKTAVSELRKAGLIRGKAEGIFAPADSATRAEAAVILYRLFNEIQS
ncbi:MAG TPA: endo-1,4-beta-xylanase [Bacilli bacterium]